MKLRSYRVERSPKLMVIPMIDIIFFLLVFFMMSTLNMVYQKSMPVNLPLASATAQQLETPLAITISATGTIHWEQEVVTIERLRERLQQTLANRPQQVIILRADQTVEHGSVVSVMDELKLAGVQKLAIATQPKPR